MRYIAFLICLLSSSITYAEYFGGQNGRAAKFDSQPTISVEATYATGDFGLADYRQLGLRLNYRLSNKAILFGDVGKSELNSENETSFGAGLFYSLGQILSWTDAVAVKASYHQVDFGTNISSRTESDLESRVDCSNGPTFFTDPFTGAITPNPTVCQTVFVPTSNTVTTSSGSGEINVFSVEAVTSSAFKEALVGRATSWYMTAGLHSFSGGFSSDTEVGFGGGFIFEQSAAMEFYAGFEFIEESFIGFGMRYSIN